MGHGNDYWFVISGRQSADIKDRAGETLYSLTRRPEADIRRGENGWVFSRPGKHPLFEVHRLRRFPCLQYLITQNGREVGSVSGLNLIRTRYFLKFDKGPGWVLYMPLFSLLFYAISDDAGAVAVQMKRTKSWGVRFGRDLDAPQLIAALAFVFIGRYESW